MAILTQSAVLAADPSIIRMDGRFDDWEDKKAAASASSNNLVESVKVANGKDDVFVAVQLSREINIQKENPLTLIVDTDSDPSTGRRIGALGVDVQYNFGSLEAIRYIDGDPISISHTEIGISWAPSFSSNIYEISMPLRLFGPPEQDVVIALAVAELDDVQATAMIVFHEVNTSAAAAPEITLNKLATPYVRILTMNVLYDGLFKNPAVYERIFKALDPDILLLSEVYEHSADQVVAVLDERFPASNASRRWYSFGRPGKVTVSKYPFLATDILLDDLYTLIDVPGFEGGLFVIHTHLECCDNDDKRQEKVEKLLSTLRTSRTDKYSMLYEYHDRPLILAGDLNLVGERRTYDTLFNGINDDLAAAAKPPSSDPATKLEEAISYHTNTPFTFTWKDDSLKWPPGKLDFTFYTSPSIHLGKSFVLFTPTMGTEALQTHGLLESDSVDASDHLPHVIDVRSQNPAANGQR